MYSPNPQGNFSPARLCCLGPGFQQKTSTITACNVRLEKQHAKKKTLSGQSPVRSFLRAQSKPQLSDLAPLGDKLQPTPLPEGCAQLKHWEQVIPIFKRRESRPGSGQSATRQVPCPWTCLQGGDDLHFFHSP